jgi:hypothetical protein
MALSPFPLSSRANPDFLLNDSHRATYVVLFKENHKPLTEAATLDWKSGGAEGSAVSSSWKRHQLYPNKFVISTGA